MGLIAYVVSRCNEWLRSGFDAAFLLSLFNFLYHFFPPVFFFSLCLLSSFPCLIFPLRHFV